MMDGSYGGSGSGQGIQLDWPTPTHPPHLGEKDVQVWCFVLDRPEDEIRLFMDWLPAEEKARAERAGTELLRRRFAARRGVVRGLLGQALGKSPRDVRILHKEGGKPIVENGSGLSFSVSHSGPTALVALARYRRVGVDVERRRPRKDPEGIARRTFSDSETEALLALPASARTEAFYMGWTRKEALAKALGEGIASSFHGFSVLLGPAEEPPLVQMDLPGESANNWALLDLEPGPGFCGALAVEDARNLVPTLWSLPLPSGPDATIFDAWRD